MSASREAPGVTEPPVAERAIGAYLEAVASRGPTPGGGSVAGVVAALAAALGEMVCNLSAPDGSAGDDLREARTALSTLRERFLALAAADEAVYTGYRAASALPRGDEAERAIRAEALRRALETATETPLLLAEGCLRALRELGAVTRGGKKSLRSDVEIAVLLADAALRGALATARGNLGGLDDETGAAFAARADAVEQAGVAARNAALGEVVGRGL